MARSPSMEADSTAQSTAVGPPQPRHLFPSPPDSKAHAALAFPAPFYTPSPLLAEAPSSPLREDISCVALLLLSFPPISVRSSFSSTPTWKISS
ncbi:hypothetical protein Cni_G08161 [Canna indica]|uniref:Uncharacterized protein n=1 Tax=Canna indica TaxID=4628 RepID=A0AAQ3K1R2_9LILI|nr:hypothetical protein Cni_G08161 [Canna indica]